ncbi:MAG: cytochrome C assembly protein [Actinobacteria bacterium]|nr:MAG: cytochrome C assembly protein [Actinomycetota bacterium]
MKLSRITEILTFAAMALIVTSIWMVFRYAPVAVDDAGQAILYQKIMYYHIPLAWVAFLAFFVVFIGGILYLKKQDSKYEILAYSSAQVGVIFTSLVLITGSMWGHLAWAPDFGWWNWSDIRLNTTLILWLLYLAYLMLGASIKEEEKRGRFLAVFGIISFIDVPLVALSIKLWASRTIHPAIIKSSGFDLDPAMKITLLFCILTFTVLYVVFLLTRYQLGKLAEDIELFKEKL